MKELIKAVNSVMTEAKSLDKNSRVGTGKSSYDGVKDIDVKALLQPLMAKNELAIFQKDIEVSTNHEVWEQTYNGQPQRKKQVFTEVKTKYVLMHSSGQIMELSSIGHGVDSQDKGAGKAQTYALKMALIYLFLIPVGNIDDTDTTHSDSYEVPSKKSNNPNKPKWLNRYKSSKNANGEWEETAVITDDWKKEVTAVRSGKKTVEQVKAEFKMSAKTEQDFLEII